MANEGDDGFQYRPSYSTSNIFYYDENATHLGILRWRPIPINPIGVNPQQLIICSSSRGLVACRNVNVPYGTLYYVGNPYFRYGGGIHLRYDSISDPPTATSNLHQSNFTRVVLSVEGSSFVLICAIQLTVNTIMFDMYESVGSTWHFSRFTTPNRRRADIVPNSGVGFGHMAFWLLEEAAQTISLLSYYCIRGDHNAGMAVISPLPPFPVGQARIQLGRALGRLGLVIVNETSSTVELFTVQGDPNSLWQSRELFNIEISQPPQPVNVDAEGHAAVENNSYGNQEAENTSIASWRQEDMTIVFREMPRPIRFDSFKVELLFWVKGRVLMLENNSSEPHEYRLTVLPDEDVPSSITDGIPHVRTYNCPSDFKKN